jgi:diguanylate cyclase (GGDEF)-like protein/PAS domain S-box-containing protein
MGNGGTEDEAEGANSLGVLPAHITRRTLRAASPYVASHYRLASAEALQQIIDAVPNPIFVKDREHRWVILNKALVHLLGRPQEELLGKSDFDVFPREQAAVFWAKDDEVFATGCPNENEEAFTDHTGKVHTMLTRKCLVQLAGTDESYLVGVISDVTLYREAEAHSRHLAYHEPLTGLPNRALFQKRLEEALQCAKNAGEGLALLLVDLDGLKAVNDLYGHAAGDELLCVVAQRLSAEARRSDTVARLGGDEFGVVQAGGQQPETALALARRIGAAVAAPIVVGEQQAIVSASIGIALFPDHGGTEEELLHHADIALYTVKRRGRNGDLFYSPELKTQAGPPAGSRSPRGASAAGFGWHFSRWC